jgi:hypothetical protein
MREHDDEREDIVTINAGRTEDEISDEILQIVADAQRNLQTGDELRHMRPW